MSSAADSWYHEKESGWLYRQIAAAEPDLHKRALFEKLAVAAEDQALHWANRGSVPPDFQPALRARVVASLAKVLGPRAVRPALAAMKLRGLSIYSAPMESAVSGHVMPTSVAQIGVRHRSMSGGNLRAAVFGVCDGLVSNASLLMGVVGARLVPHQVLLTGVAGLLAGALSMAAGEYLSMRSQREMYEYQIGLERDELAEYPEEEAEELALIYAARGIPLDQARAMSTALLADPERALDALAREELGLNPDDLGSPWGAAIASFAAFAVGALVPLIPFLLGVNSDRALLTMIALTLVALFAVGMALSLFTGRGALSGGLRMMLIGAGAGVVSYMVGQAIAGS